MKLSNVMVAAAMVVGSVGAIGCSAPAAASALGEAAAAPTSEASSFFVGVRERFGFGGVRERFGFGERVRFATPFVRDRFVYGRGYDYGYTPVYVRFAPPAPRYEYVGRAPSAQHIWMNGYQKWNGREYVWVGGHWDVRRDGHLFVQPHYDVVEGRTRFIPGHWVS